MADNGAHATEEDPAAEFLAKQESEIAGIENDGDEEGFGTLEGPDEPQSSEQPPPDDSDFFGEEPSTVNGDKLEDFNGPTDNYAAIAMVDIQRQEPESLRKWREEQKTRLEALDLASKAAEAEWKKKAKKELEDWYAKQIEQMVNTKETNRNTQEAFIEENEDTSPGSEWKRVARLCDFTPNNRRTKDITRIIGLYLKLKDNPIIRE